MSNEEQIPPKPKDKRTKRYKEWVARYESSSSGVGDTVEKITKATGIKKAVEFVAGEDCGCDKRKDKLNYLFPYNKPNCFTEQEFDHLEGIFSDKIWQRRSPDGEQVRKIYSIYNRVFNVSDTPSGCGSCVLNRLNKLERLYKEYLD
jgi:hypothetical protein